MVFAVGKCPIGCLIGSLFALGCGGDALNLADLGLGKIETAAVSGRPAPAVSADSLVSGAGASAPVAGAAAGYEGQRAGAGGAGTGASGGTGVSAGAGAVGVDGTAGVAGAAGAPDSLAGAGGSGRWRRRGGTGGTGGSGSSGSSGGAADGGSSGERGTGRGGADGGRAGSGGLEADGCIQNLACQLPAPPTTGDAHQDCVDRINQFREECACLPPLERWVEGEECADEMARYDSASTEPHAAFGAGLCEGGSAQNECPGWRSEEQIVGVCLQRMWDEGPPPMSDCNGTCFQMYGHFLNMTNQRMTKVACGFHEREDGQVWSVQNFAR